MISPDFVRMMARYNAWQNQSLVSAASGLDDTARRLDRAAFFGSIAATFNHLYWGDSIWMWRFGRVERPAGRIADSGNIFAEWADFVAARQALDQVILDWADALPAPWLDGEMRWNSVSAGREVSRDHGLLVVHFFNHQTHHRGQIHAMLTAAGAKPDDTDLFLLPDRA